MSVVECLCIMEPCVEAYCHLKNPNGPMQDSTGLLRRGTAVAMKLFKPGLLQRLIFKFIEHDKELKSNNPTNLNPQLKSYFTAILYTNSEISIVYKYSRLQRPSDHKSSLHMGCYEKREQKKYHGCQFSLQADTNQLYFVSYSFSYMVKHR